MKDHEIRELVNQLRDIAIEYHSAGQLREKIARTVRAAILQAQSDDDGEPTDDERIMAIEGIHNYERCGDEGWVVSEIGITRCACGQAGNSPALTVWYGDMPETNGKTNWTAILHRKGECLSTGITIDRSEYPDRVRYEADRMRYLIGDLEYEPDILEYDSDAHSGYVPPAAAPGNSPAIPDGYVMVPKVPSQTHLNSIAMRYRHDFYLLNDAQKDSALATARQMYEECSGQGFYTLPAGPQEVKGE
ncbi:hypothetical protein NYO12_09855 [Klebsiella variicola]|uniref:hypothetical protein n=1 Tax=Klebsiella variicola TaxID=244366 RepID=UPI0021691BFB|nr:hypothetical protein [Klebsiella variicola]UVW54629.1 hypothetical protein NYO12_09855 [Klebsiella variicola]